MSVNNPVLFSVSFTKMSDDCNTFTFSCTLCLVDVPTMEAIMPIVMGDALAV